VNIQGLIEAGHATLDV
jgi:hypothetical protein